MSIATVSRVLNDDPAVGEQTRRRVLEVVHEVGYVRRVGRREVAEGIALAYAGPASLGSPYDQALLGGVGRAIDDNAGGDGFGHDLLIVDLKRSLRDGESPSALFRRKGIKAALIRTTDAGRPLCERLAGENFPGVVVGARFGGDSAVSYVDADSRAASREAVEHLLELGHRRVWVVANARDDTDHLDRIAGWRDAMTDAGLPAGDEGVRRPWATLQAGIDLVRGLAEIDPDERPTALYVADPLPGFGALRGAMELGLRVPGDMSLIGFDDGEQRHLTHPTMAAVCQDTAALGAAAVDVLRRRIAAGRSRPVRRTLPTRYEPGPTVGPPSTK